MTVGHNGINAVRNGRAVWEPNPCALPHYDYSESTCIETAGHSGPHAAPLIISGRECGAVAWDEPKDPMTIRHTVDSITSDALDVLYEQLDAAEAGEAQRQLATAREALASATTRAARAEAAVGRVRALHRRNEHTGDCEPCSASDYPDYAVPHPCPTIRALDGEQPAPDRPGKTCCGQAIGHLPGCAVNQGEQPAPVPAATQATEPDPFSYEERERTGRNGGLHRFTVLPVDPEAERAATDRAVQATLDNERSTEWITAHAAPREHCGHLMPAWVAGPRSECVLRPGHTGSHADDRGARWWYDPTGDSSGPCTCGGRFPLQHLHADQHQPKEQP